MSVVTLAYQDGEEQPEIACIGLDETSTVESLLTDASGSAKMRQSDVSDANAATLQVEGFGLPGAARDWRLQQQAADGQRQLVLGSGLRSVTAGNQLYIVPAKKRGASAVNSIATSGAKNTPLVKAPSSPPIYHLVDDEPSAAKTHVPLVQAEPSFHSVQQDCPADATSQTRLPDPTFARPPVRKSNGFGRRSAAKDTPRASDSLSAHLPSSTSPSSSSADSTRSPSSGPRKAQQTPRKSCRMISCSMNAIHM